jgi:hypothetical protein
MGVILLEPYLIQVQNLYAVEHLFAPGEVIDDQDRKGVLRMLPREGTREDSRLGEIISRYDCATSHQSFWRRLHLQRDKNDGVASRASHIAAPIVSRNAGSSTPQSTRLLVQISSWRNASGATPPAAARLLAAAGLTPPAPTDKSIAHVEKATMA